LSIEDKYDEVRQLINIGKEKGYLLYDEVNELLPSEITSSEELDDLFNTFGSAGIEVLDSDQKFRDDKGFDRTGEGPKSSRSTSRRAPSTRRTTRCACTCARWARFRC
jgi:RNA polymerase primary sigma factor